MQHFVPAPFRYDTEDLILRTVQKSTKKPRKFYNTSRTRRGPLTTSPNRRRRPSRPSGKDPLEWYSQQTRE